MLALAGATSSQWGLVTTAQANALGVDRLALSRLTAEGHLVRLAHGVYRMSGAPSPSHEGLRAAWLSTEPRTLAEIRIANLTSGVVVAGVSAAILHEIGDNWANRHEFIVGTRRQSQRQEIRFRKRSFEANEVTLAEGLPVLRLERTIVDLLDDIRDLSLVGDALTDAAAKQSLNLDYLVKHLGRLARRVGFPAGDGHAVLEALKNGANRKIRTT